MTNELPLPEDRPTTDLAPDPMSPSDPATQEALGHDEQGTARDPGRGPTPDEEAAAERGAANAPAVSEAYEHALKTGAHVQGEGEIK